MTGAAWNLFFVKTAAAEHGLSEAIKAKSGKRVLDGLTPTWMPETEKPFGYVPDSGMYFCLDGGIEPSTGAEYDRACCGVEAFQAFKINFVCSHGLISFFCSPMTG